MKVYILILIALLNSTVSISQEGDNRKIFIVDKSNNQPIEYAHVVDEKGRIISISDNNGGLEIPIDKQDKNANFFNVYRYGYEKFIFNSNEKIDTISLSQKIENLNEVVIIPSKNDIVFLKYYFKTYDTKNGTIRRYIDGIVEYEINKEKNSIDRKILEYRSLQNDTMISKEESWFVQVTLEGTTIPNYKLRSIYDFNKKYNDYKIVQSDKEINNLIIKDPKTSKEIGKIYIDDDGREKSAYLLEENYSSETRKAYGSEGKVVLRLEEEHYVNLNDYYLKDRQIIKKSLFRQKRKKEDFAEYISFSKLIFIESSLESKEKGVKFRRSSSNYTNEFWKNQKYSEISKPLVSINKLNQNLNKN
ncbi:hypothetical protein [uncultured Christiangramia sp.]|uniref:hypothetical protein n=1 Tax=uncultured Christiangramia sp. TaxID=503836 RepID=UPI0026260A97|nr:hypothetical protein [uncultured Christiangramia sp.]